MTFLLVPFNHREYTALLIRDNQNLEVYNGMSMQEYVEGLRSKHAHLEEEIDDELHRPMPDQMTLTRLKREKLKIKDEIARLGTTSLSATSTTGEYH
ncbi:MAG: YdcH family protein [Alphaproteobacteria bacterium]